MSPNPQGELRDLTDTRRGELTGAEVQVRERDPLVAAELLRLLNDILDL